MKRLKLAALIVLLSLATHWCAIAQQVPQYTHYMFNNYLVNPALAGTHNFYQIRSTNRFQWVGVPDAPQTFSLSAYGPHSTRSMGFGGSLFNDLTGPTQRLGGNFSYAYNMQISTEMRVSGGLSLGFLMFRVDGTKLDLGDGSTGVLDPALFTNSKSVFTPDASMGVYFYSPFYFVGLAGHQLFGQRLMFIDTLINNSANRLRQHVMLHGGYLFNINRQWQIEPSLLVKYMPSAPIQIDLNARMTYRRQFWFGLTGRWMDGVAILFGYEYDKSYLFGYSFDYSFTGIRRFQGGSHELMIGIMFDKLK